jgi:hypothetical protein
MSYGYLTVLWADRVAANGETTTKVSKLKIAEC